MTHPLHPKGVEAAARVICYWDGAPGQDGGACRDNPCAGECRAKMVDGIHLNVAERTVTAYLQEAGDGWQPIADAPKDGWFDVFMPGLAEQGSLAIYPAFWSSDAGGPLLVHDEEILDTFPATHWRPLPTPPGEKGT